jgi:hypothetical protein
MAYTHGSKLLLLALVLCVSACANQGDVMGQRTDTSVALSSNNYKVIKAGAEGESTGFYLFGFIPIVSPNAADAKASLYANVGHPLEGRSVALANQTEDRSNMYLLLFSIPKLKVTADVIEFTN